jgi:hypothetical protein
MFPFIEDVIGCDFWLDNRQHVLLFTKSIDDGMFFVVVIDLG